MVYVCVLDRQPSKYQTLKKLLAWSLRWNTSQTEGQNTFHEFP